MKAVMLSIQPKWVDKIIKGEKTIEVRKNRPKLETPFKCYIYCTKHKEKLLEVLHKGDDCYGGKYDNNKPAFIKGFADTSLMGYWGISKVIGEFVCDYIRAYEPTKAWTLYGKAIHYLGNALEYRHTALYYDEIEEYGNGATLYAWHISELKIYDKPNDIEDFRVPCIKDCKKCSKYVDKGGFGICHQLLERPPQSWCYVEEDKKSQ